MAKPIITVGISDMVLNNEYDIIQRDLSKKMPDYHVLVYVSSKIEDGVKFECFYEKDFKEVDYEELKKIINDKTNK